ncbi:hypothetical protein JW777_01670 [bacterium]|nr:hypothetical protein [bacterium]
MRMNAFQSLILSLLFIPAVLNGQSRCLVIVEEVKTPPMFGFPAKTRKATTWLKNGDLRRDEGERSRTLLALSSGEAWLVNHRDSTVVPLSEATLQGLSMFGVGLFGLPVDAVTGRPSVPDKLFRKTGRVQAIGGRKAEEVEVRIPAPAGTVNPPQAPVLWIGTDGTPRMTEYLAVLKRLLGSAAADYEPLFEQLQRLKGYPLRIQAAVLGQELTQTLLSADSARADASVFRLPDGYRRGSTKAVP